MLSGFPTLTQLQTSKQSELSRMISHPFPRLSIPEASKRPNEASQSPDTKRQKVVEKASPSLSPRVQGGAGAVGQRPPSAQLHAASIPHPAQPSQQPSQVLQPSPIPPHPTTTPAPNPVKSPVVPAAYPPTSAPNTIATSKQQPFPTFATLVERLKAIEVEIKAIDAKLQDAQSSGNTAAVEALQKERLPKFHFMAQLRNLVVQSVKASKAAMAGSNTAAGGSGEPSQPPPQTQPQPAASSHKSEDAAPLTVPAPASVPAEEQKPPISNQQALMQFMQARGGPGGFPSASPEVAAQMQKLINRTGIQSQPFGGSPKPRAAPPPAPVSITQPELQPQASTSSGGSKYWEGSFTFTTSIQNEQPKGLEVQVAVTHSTGDLYVVDRSFWFYY